MRKIIFIFGIFILGCSTTHEYSLIYSDIGFDVMSVRPAIYSNNDYVFRLYANNAKSLDRVITLTADKDHFFSELISKDTTLTQSEKTNIYGSDSIIYSGNIKYFGRITKNLNTKKKYSYQVEEIDDQRIKNIISRLNEIDLFQFNTRSEFVKLADYSSYIIEIKKGDEYNSFRFCTLYPHNDSDNMKSEYEYLENFLFDLFPELLKIK